MKEPDPNIWKDPFFWTAFLIGAFVLSLTLWYGAGMAQSIVCYGSWLWKEYHLPPFVGFFNHTFPGIYIVGRLAMELFGDSVLALRILDLMVQLTCLPMIFYLVKRISHLSIAGFFAAVFYAFFYYGLSKDDTMHREDYVFWALLLGLTVCFVWENRFRLRAFLVGIILGFVFLLKPTYGLAWPVFGILFLIQGITKRRKPALFELCLFGFACALPALLTVLYYRWVGMDALRQLYFDNITFNSEIYSVMADPTVVRGIFWTEKIPELIFRLYPLVFFSGLAIIAFQAFKGAAAKDQALFQMLLAMALISIVNYRMQGKYFNYHFVPTVAFMIIFSGWAVGIGADWIGRKTRPAIAAFTVTTYAVIMIVLMISTAVSPGLRRYARQHAFRSFEKAYRAPDPRKEKIPRLANNYRVADYLRPLLTDQDQVVCFGPYPLINFLLKKKSPAYVVFVQHLLFRRLDGAILPVQEQMMKEYSEQVIKARPRFFLFSNTFTVRGKKTFKLINGDAWTALEEQFPDLYQFFLKNYRLRKTIGEVEIYEFQAPGASQP